jgi:hypothetical protein
MCHHTLHAFVMSYIRNIYCSFLYAYSLNIVSHLSFLLRFSWAGELTRLLRYERTVLEMTIIWTTDSQLKPCYTMSCLLASQSHMQCIRKPWPHVNHPSYVRITQRASWADIDRTYRLRDAARCTQPLSTVVSAILILLTPLTPSHTFLTSLAVYTHSSVIQSHSSHSSH